MGSNWIPQYCLSVCFVLAILDLSITNGMMLQYSPSSNLTRIRRQANGCDGYKCEATQECIDKEKECDGTVDCQDGSDEFNTCANKPCPTYMFICDYGACIDADKRCDRKKDCRDNSDEALCLADVKPLPVSHENCKSNQFRCNSGQCIELDRKCNGISDCPDNSDETKEPCLNIYCPDYTFKCDYGGCVDGSARCNGVQECLDNSDEENCDATATQPPVVVTYKPITTGPGGTTEGSKRPSQYGVCIIPNYPEDGSWKIQGNYQAKPGEKVEVDTSLVFSCKEGYKLSAENPRVTCLAKGWSIEPPICKRLCPPLYTNPNYTVDCFDADKRRILCTDATSGSTANFDCETYYEPSDQSSTNRFCYQGRWNPPTPICIPGPDGTTGGPWRLSQFRFCTVPDLPEGDSWKVQGNYQVKPGEKVKVGTKIALICKEGYKLYEENSWRICLVKGWNIDPPTCYKLCPPPYSDHVTKVKCFDAYNREINCMDAVTGSTAKVECETNYEPSDQSLTTSYCKEGSWYPLTSICIPELCPPLYSNPVTKVKCFDADKREIKCTDATSGSIAKFDCPPYYEPSDQSLTTSYCKEGSWYPPTPICIPVCGEKIVSVVPLIVSGTKVVKGDYPWVTAVYHKYHDQYVNVCGGSILNQRVIVTAAHCVTNEFGDVIDKSIVAVGVGKYYNRYNDSRDTEAQYSKIEKIIKHEKFKGENQRYASDIALLVTKDTLLLSKIVQPVCFSNLPQIHLTPSLEGVVTGWGFTLAGGEPSDYLKEVTVPYKDDATCYQELPTEWADKYLSYDKLCAGLYNKSTAVCKGDSGGGLVFKDCQRNRYFIHGIVSVANKISGGCDIQVSTLYTKVATHYEWLKRQVAQYTL